MGGPPSTSSLDDWYDKAWDADVKNDQVFHLPEGWTVGDKVILVDSKAAYSDFIAYLKSHSSVS